MWVSAVHQRSQPHPPRPIRILPGPVRRSGSLRHGSLPLISLRKGAAKVRGPVLREPSRLLMVRARRAGGWVSINAPAWTLFAPVGAAMVVFRPWHGLVDSPDALGQIFFAVADMAIVAIRFVAMRLLLGEMSMVCRFGFIVTICARCRRAPPQTRRPTLTRRGSLADAGGRAKVRVTQVRRSHLRGRDPGSRTRSSGNRKTSEVD